MFQNIVFAQRHLVLSSKLPILEAQMCCCIDIFFQSFFFISMRRANERKDIIPVLHYGNKIGLILYSANLLYKWESFVLIQSLIFLCLPNFGINLNINYENFCFYH